MAIQTLNTIKNWFKTGLKPTQTQFWDSWDSFRHKSEKVSVVEIDGINELLQNKTEIDVFENHLTDPEAHDNLFEAYQESINGKLDKGGYTGSAKNIDDRISAIENPDRVLKFGLITLTGLNVSIAENAFAWILNKTSYATPDAYANTITAATAGMYRTDIVVGNEMESYEIVQGNEASTGGATAEPPVPLGKIKVGFISIFGNTIVDSGSAPAVEKVSIVDSDRIVIDDSADSFSKKVVKWSTIKALLKSWFDTQYQAKDNQIEIGGSGNVQNSWNGQTILFTSNCTITVPATLNNSLMFPFRTLAGVTVTWAITPPFTWETTPTAIPEKTVGYFMRRAATNTIILDV